MIAKYQTFAEFLTQIRMDRKLTLRQVAAKLNVSPAYYSEVEKGRRNTLSLEKIESFSDITNMTADEK